MSHLSILPTVLHDVERLAESLESFGLQVHRGGELTTPVGSQTVCLWVRVEGGQQLGWRQSSMGSLELVADLERVSRDHSLQTLLSRLTRAYAARQALDRLQHCPGAVADSSFV
jgi:hypothetical protein